MPSAYTTFKFSRVLTPSNIKEDRRDADGKKEGGEEIKEGDYRSAVGL